MRLSVLSGFRVLLVTLAACAPALADGEQVALLPIQAPALVGSAAADLDTRVRKLAAGLGLQLQSAEETNAHVEEALRAGLQCTLVESSCAQRIGLIADVDQVLVIAVEPYPEGKQLMRARMVATSSDDKRTAAGAVASDDDVSKLLRRLIDGSGAPLPLPFRITVAPEDARVVVDGEKRASSETLWLLPGEHVLHVEAPDHESDDRVFVVTEDGALALTLALRRVAVNVPLLAGLGVAGFGVLVGGAGVALATASEVNLASGTVAFADRGDLVGSGILGLGAAGIGAAILVAGGAVAVVGVLE